MQTLFTFIQVMFLQLVLEHCIHLAERFHLQCTEHFYMQPIRYTHNGGNIF
jgi:hypothetical protein